MARKPPNPNETKRQRRARAKAERAECDALVAAAHAALEQKGTPTMAKANRTPGEVTEAHVIIDGTTLTFAQVMSLRVAVSGMRAEMQDPEHAKNIGVSLADGYNQRLGEVERLLVDGGNNPPESVKPDDGFDRFLQDATLLVRDMWESRKGAKIGEQEAQSLNDVLTQWFTDKRLGYTT
jgi:hypothetical protein